MITAALIILLLTERAPSAAVRESESTADLLFVALLAGMSVAAFFGWRRSAALDNIWQRGVISVLSPFGALVLVFLLSIPARQLFGIPGLVILLAVTATVGVLGSRWSAAGASAGQPKDAA